MSEQERDGRDESVVWGRHAVAEALAAGHPVNRVYLARQARGPDIERIKELARQRQVRFDFVDVGKLGALSGTRQHQDVVARLSPVAYVTLDELLARLPDGRPATLVVLDQVQHPGNLGMAIRTAAGAGADGLLLPTRGGRLVSEEVVHAAAGAVYRLPVVASAHLRDDLQRLKDLGFWIYGLAAHAPQVVWDVEWSLRRVLVAGNEARGLRPSVAQATDALVSIPLAPGLDSLNVAVALGVALFEVRRRDRAALGISGPLP